MKDLIVTSGIVGSVLPFLVAVILQTHWKDGFKSIVTFIICIVAAIVTLWGAGELDWTSASFNTENLVATFLTIYAAAQAFYRGLWRPTGAAPAVEEATTKSEPSRT